MAYTINKTDGSVVATITDGTVDNTTSVQLFGKSFSGFGEGLNENLVKLLENSAGTGAPSAPLRGELWFDTNTNQIKVYDGSSFKPTGGSKTGNTAPTSPSVGDLWTNTDDDQVFVYTGDARTHQVNSKWELVGPVFTAGQTQSGWKIETIPSAGGNKVVSSMYVGNTRVAIVSKEDFTPSSSQTGFTEIKSGMTLNATLGAVFEGTNTSATFLNVSGTTNNSGLIAGGNFLRADVADTTTGGLTIDADAGLTVGDDQELTVTVTSNNVTVAQTSQDKDIKFTVNDGGVTKTPLQLTGADGGVDISGDVTITGNLNVSGAYSYTSSDIVEHTDNFLKVNTGQSEQDGGLIVETTDTDDARLFYDVSENRWSAGQNQVYSKLVLDSDATADGDANKNTKFLRTTAAGNIKVTSANLGVVGSAIATTDTSSTAVPTIGQVATFGNLWGGAEKYVSTANPTGGDGSDGDIWFVREA